MESPGGKNQSVLREKGIAGAAVNPCRRRNAQGQYHGRSPGRGWPVPAGAAMEYAAVHQFGAVIKPKSAKALFVPGYGMLKKAVIPDSL